MSNPPGNLPNDRANSSHRRHIPAPLNQNAVLLGSPLPAVFNPAGGAIVDDISALPQRYADTGYGRPSFFQRMLNNSNREHTRRTTLTSQPQRSPTARNDPSRSHAAHAPQRSYASSRDSTLRSPPDNMSRLSGFVDLTASTSSVPRTRPRPQLNLSSSSASPEAGPSTKRRRHNDTHTGNIPLLDLSQDDDDGVGEDDTPLAQAKQKQQVEAIKAQQDKPEKPVRISSLSCIICMEPPTDLTITACGHWFCSRCLFHALIAGETVAGRRSQCPVCRHSLKRDKAADMVPVLFKTMKKKK